MRLSLVILSLVTGLPACAVAGWAQLAPSPDAAPVSTAPAPLGEEPVASFRQDVNLVDLFFTVKDNHGSLVPHLSEQSCSVLDDNVPQTLKSFVAETGQPLTLGILLDTSVSQVPWLPMEEDAAAEFLRQVLRSKDEAFLLSFDVDVRLLQDYTNSPSMLIHAMSKAEINEGGGSPTLKPLPSKRPVYHPKVDPGPVPRDNPRGTLFYDAIYQAANEKMNQEAGRKAIIVLTDGDDQGSSATSHDAIAAAEKNNILVYVVWAGDTACFNGAERLTFPALPGVPAPPPPARRMLEDGAAECDRADHKTPCPGYHFAECISQHSGGRIIVAANKRLDAAFQQIEDELRSQYVASYTPNNARDDGRFHKIDVRCRGDNGQELKVHVRRGYYAAKAANQAP